MIGKIVDDVTNMTCFEALIESLSFLAAIRQFLALLFNLESEHCFRLYRKVALGAGHLNSCVMDWGSFGTFMLKTLRAYLPETLLVGSVLSCCILLIAEDLRADFPAEEITLKGRLGTGVECPLLHTDNGMKYALVGSLETFKAGDRVQIKGVPQQTSICMQGPAIHVQAITARP
jgi:hypothetical protein